MEEIGVSSLPHISVTNLLKYFRILVEESIVLGGNNRCMQIKWPRRQSNNSNLISRFAQLAPRRPPMVGHRDTLDAFVQHHARCYSPPCCGLEIKGITLGDKLARDCRRGVLASKFLEGQDVLSCEPLCSDLVEVTMEKTLEQRYAVKFCVKLNKTPKDTYDMLKDACGDVCMSYWQAMKWHKSLREGREDVNDEARSGRPSTSRKDEHVTQVREFLNTDRRMSVRMISEQLNLPKTIVHEIVSEDLAMRKICAKLVKTMNKSATLLDLFGYDLAAQQTDLEIRTESVRRRNACPGDLSSRLTAYRMCNAVNSEELRRAVSLADVSLAAANRPLVDCQRIQFNIYFAIIIRY
ncbi:hypothetical protein NQ318_005500 [Aromia moschata]|uniref:HTH cro/C1-type domain-containing protein n=1 Tax=Aromia moschata TaxID=1265417 RepID=A0AAV8YBN5_9CUCU|nr:hypothetical protein NQ318_005500 [Aromia moschata]